MKLTPSLAITILLASAFTSNSFAEEMAAQPQIDSVGLFKNGLCVVKCSFTADRAGDFVWNEPPRVVHGTFLGESEGAVTIRSTTRKADDPTDAALPTGNLQADLAGAEVKLTLSADETKTGSFVTARVWIMPQTNPGQRSCLHITKALSLQTDHTEIEESGKRENEIWIGGRRSYRTTVKAEATARNFRSAPVTLLMKAQFSGALVEAEEKPSDTLRREGVFSVNPRHELEWKLTLPPGAEKKVTYRYTVLVSS